MRDEICSIWKQKMSARMPSNAVHDAQDWLESLTLERVAEAVSFWPHFCMAQGGALSKKLSHPCNMDF